MWRRRRALRASGGWPGAVHTEALGLGLGGRHPLSWSRPRYAPSHRSAELVAARDALSDGVLALQDADAQAAVINPSVCPWPGLAAYDSSDAALLRRARAAGRRDRGARRRLLPGCGGRQLGQRQVLRGARRAATCACRRGTARKRDLAATGDAPGSAPDGRAGAGRIRRQRPPARGAGRPRHLARAWASRRGGARAGRARRRPVRGSLDGVQRRRRASSVPRHGR